MTPAELSMCKILRGLGFAYKFQRWFTTNKYITDFWLPINTISKKKVGLIIEVDGGYHLARVDYDKERERVLLKEKRVNKILRFPNKEILTNTEKVKLEIIDIVTQLRNA